MPAKIAIPTTPDELNEMLNDSKQMKKVVEEESLGEFIKNYVGAVNNKDASINEQVEELAEKAIAKFFQENEQKYTKSLNLSPYGPKTKAERQAGHNPKAAGAPLDSLFNSTGEFFHLISDVAAKTAERDEKRGKIHSVMNALSSTVPSEGGFLIPERLRSELLRVSLESAIVRPRARVIPMDSLRVPFPAIDSTSNASTIYGGVQAYWAEEGASLTASDPKFKRVVLEAKKLTTYTEVPSELFQDSLISMTALIDDIFPEALAWFEDVSFFEGNGIGEPLGFLNAPAAVTVTEGTANEVNWVDVVNMYARMLPSSLSRAVWIAHQSALPQLLQMEISAGSPAVWVNPQLSQGPPMSLLGRPLIITEKAEALGTTGALNFVDFGFYLLGDRQAMIARQSEEYQFKNDKVAFRITERVDGRPWLTDAITPRNGSDTLSPFVKLLSA